MPVKPNGDIIWPDPEAPEKDAFGSTCSLRCVEEYCCFALKRDVSNLHCACQAFSPSVSMQAAAYSPLQGAG